MCHTSNEEHLPRPPKSSDSVSHRLLVAAALFVPAVASAQRTCSLLSWKEQASGVVGYANCATDLSARLITPIRIPAVLQHGWDAGSETYTGVQALIIVDTNGVPGGILLPRGARMRADRREALTAMIRSWRFRPARREERPVAVFDSVIIYPTNPVAHRPPVPCLDCDPRRSTTRWRVRTARPDKVLCDTALAIIASGAIAADNDWVYPIAPRCPGAGAALASFVRKTRIPRPGAGEFRRYPHGLFATIRSPQVASELMQKARQGDPHVFRLLAYQAGDGFSRVNDTLPGRWDTLHDRPTYSCGPIKIALPSADIPFHGVDPRLTGRIRALAESIASTPTASPEIRTPAWCLAAQLR